MSDIKKDVQMHTNGQHRAVLAQQGTNTLTRTFLLQTGSIKIVNIILYSSDTKLVTC